MKRIFTAIAVSSVALLAACSGEPSNGNLETALEKVLNESRTQSAGTMFDIGKFKIHSVKKLGCQPDGGGFKCDIETDVESEKGGRKKASSTWKVVKGSDGWQFTK